MVKNLDSAIPASVREHIDGLGSEMAARLLQGMSASTIPMAMFDPGDRLVYFCPGFAKLYDLQDGPQTFSSLIRHCYATRQGPLLETTDIDSWLQGAHLRRRSVPHRRFEIDFVDGRWFQALETTFDDGWVLLVLVDLTAFKAKEADLTIARDAAIEEAQTDELTGVSSRRAIMDYLDGAIRNASDRHPLSIALIDLDYFKQINDTLGHDVGDEVLHHLGLHLGGEFRNTDHAGRVGGEEFLLVLPGADIMAAWLALQRFRHSWSRASALLPRTTESATFSAGIAQWQLGQNSRELYREADMALYSAKSAGRSRTVCANGLNPGDVQPDLPKTLKATGTSD